MLITTTLVHEGVRPLALGRNSRTRVIHKLSGSQSVCGASRRNLLVVKAEAEHASESVFCVKCFPGGKPARFFTVEV